MMDEADLAVTRIAWEHVRADYEARSMTRNAICAKHAITLVQLNERATRARWVREDSDAIDRRLLINQLLALLERQFVQLDITMTTTGEEEVAVLGNLARHLEKLIALDKAEARHQPGETETLEMRDIRIKLAKRINALTKG